MFRHIIYAIFFRQLVNKTADCFNNIVFILVAKIRLKRMWKNGKLLKVGKDLTLVSNRNAEMLRLIGAYFDSKAASLIKMRKKILIFPKSLHFFVLFVCRC